MVPVGFAAPLARRHTAVVHTSYAPFFMLHTVKYNKSRGVCGCRVPGSSPLWVPGRSTRLPTGVRVGCRSHHLLVFLNAFRDLVYRKELPILRLRLTYQG